MNDAPEPTDLADEVAYQPGSIVSKVILKSSAGTVTLFAFGEGQGLSEHTAPFDALVLGMDGEAEITIAEGHHRVRDGQRLLLPANVPHSVLAVTPFKMLLVMIRDRSAP